MTTKLTEEEIKRNDEARILYEDMPYDKWRFPIYLNSHTVGNVGGTDITVCDVINAQQSLGNNIFLLAKKGAGKTQALIDNLRNRYNGKGIVFEGTKDFSVDDILKTTNLDKLRTAETTEEVVQLAERVKHHFIGVDEITRFPEVVQTEVLRIMNGYVMHKGAPVYFGDGHCSGIVTGNMGNGYVATFALDDALADRCHLFLNLDYWKPTDEDMAEVDMRTDIDPRVVLSPLQDLSDKIIAIQKALRARETKIEFTIIGRYLERALDYCEQFPKAGNSKDNLRQSWPVICTKEKCALKDTICGRVKSVGERSNRAMKSLAKGILYMAELKNPRLRDEKHTGTGTAPMDAGILAAKLILPYAEVISKNYLNSEGIHGNPNIAMEEIGTQLEKDIKDEFYTKDKKGNKTSGPLLTAVAFAGKGLLGEKHTYTATGKWRFANPLLEKINKEQKRKETEEKK